MIGMMDKAVRVLNLMTALLPIWITDYDLEGYLI